MICPRRSIKDRIKWDFPVPLSEWLRDELKDFIQDIFHSENARHREYLNPSFDIQSLIESEGKFTRKVWGLLSLELWQQEFHDKSKEYQKYKKENALMKVLITGGAGFIGSFLADRLLQRGDEVLVIDNYSTGRRDNLKPHDNLHVVEGTIADSRPGK